MASDPFFVTRDSFSFAKDDVKGVLIVCLSVEVRVSTEDIRTFGVSIGSTVDAAVIVIERPNLLLRSCLMKSLPGGGFGCC